MFSLVRPAATRISRVCACRFLASDSSSTSSQDGNKIFDLYMSSVKGQTNASDTKPLSLCRTTQNDPAQHNIKHQGLFYSIEPEAFQRWMSTGLHPDFYSLIRAFNENCLMVRQPAVEIMECMRAANYSAPIIRYLLYGRAGSGKSTTLAHVIHHCGVQGWVVVHVPWAPLLHRYSKERVPSTFKEGRLDQPADSAKWLAHLMKLNDPLFKSLDLKTVNKYTWSKREVTEVGSPLLGLIDFGLQRVKYASDVMGAVIKELKMQASAGSFKLLVAIDGVNGFWERSTFIREESRHKFYQAQELSMVQHLQKLLHNDWNGGAVVCSVDEAATIKPHEDKMTSFMPRYLLGKEGFELFDPFIPVHVTNYSDKEVLSCIEYFIDRKWIQNPIGHTDDGKKEMIFLSSKNPRELYRVSRVW